MKSHIGWSRERSISYKGVKTISSRRVLKTVRITAIRNEPKQTISSSNGLRLLQMVLELVTEQCAKKDTGLPRGVDREIPHRLEKERIEVFRV